MTENASSTITQAAFFAAEKHKFQKRKADGSPYINHPLGVAMILETEGNVNDPVILQAAILHDTIEDTDTSLTEVEDIFGAKVAGIVCEVTDDKSLSREERKREQIRHVAKISDDAKLVKLADKLHNCRDLLRLPPPSWNVERVQGYIIWSKAVLASARGLNPKLDAAHDHLYETGKFTFDGEEYPALPKMSEIEEANFLEEHLQSLG
jgi:guanosine-3',5'-bis(diphosphate) 3'-pyrophosphohydrolase